MRYITNENGYIQAVSFNNLLECQNKLCTEYTGTVPTGYESLSEWSETANINAYKIVEGNLTYDSEEDARLQSLWASQETSSINDAEILNAQSNSTTDTYSCDYVNNKTQQDIVTDGAPVKCGYKVDGKDVYVKRINCGNLPNTSYIDIPMGISGKIEVIDIKGIATSSSGNKLPIPYYAPNNLGITMSYQTTNAIRLQTDSDRSTATAVVNVYFTYN